MDNYTPKCFEKLLPKIQSYLKQSSYNPLNDNNHINNNSNSHKRLIKGKDSNIILEITKTNSIKYSMSTLSELSPSLIIDELKNWTHITQWLPCIQNVIPLSKWNDYCEIIDMTIYLPYLTYVNYYYNSKFLFFWSFSSEDQCYYMLFKPINNSSSLSSLMKYGAIIINVEPGLEINKDNILSTKCIISAFIKFNRFHINLPFFFSYLSLSLISTPFDWIIYQYGKVFCSSISNFLGIVEMKQYCINSPSLSSSSSDLSSLTQFQYIISYLQYDNFINITLCNNNSNSRKISYDNHTSNNLNNPISQLPNAKVNCTMDKNDLNQIKSFLEIKRKAQEKFNSGYYKDRDLIRFIIAYQGNVDVIINILEDFANYRKNNLYYYENSLSETIKNRYSNSIYCIMKDLYNRPVIQVDIASLLFNEAPFFEHKSFISFLLVFLDDLFERIDVGIDKVALVVNMHNFSEIDGNSERFGLLMKEFEELIRILMRFYVERLGEVYLININDSFILLWKIVGKMIGNVIKKVEICYNIRQDLAEVFTNEQINDLLS